MNKLQIFSAFSSLGFTIQPRLLDEVYDPVSLPDAQSAWKAAVDTLDPRLTQEVDIGGGLFVKRPLYLPGVFECNKIDRWLAVEVYKAKALQAVISNMSANSPAFGPLSYYIGGSGAGHDIAWGADEDKNGNVFLYFLEDQTGDQVPLTQAEIQSCFFAEAA